MFSSSLWWVTIERWPVEIFNKNNYSSLPLFSPEVSSLPLLLLKFHLHHNPLHLSLIIDFLNLFFQTQTKIGWLSVFVMIRFIKLRFCQCNNGKTLEKLKKTKCSWSAESQIYENPFFHFYGSHKFVCTFQSDNLSSKFYVQY